MERENAVLINQIM